MAGLSSAALLAQSGQQVLVLEQNWLPGGCASTYPRKQRYFESGATTLVGLDPGMPLHWLLQTLGISLEARTLEVPMTIHFPEGDRLVRHQNLGKWIVEAESFFGPQHQQGFWEECFAISQFVWQTSLQQRAFPPSNARDLVEAVKHFRPRQLAFATKAFTSTYDLLKRHRLHQHQRFMAFVNEQLMITAQNVMQEVNVLFGATALCYTNYGNYSLDGGMIKLAEALVGYIEQAGGEVRLQQPVSSIRKEKGKYVVQTTFRQESEQFESQHLVAAIPINNLLELWQGDIRVDRLRTKMMDSRQLNSAFQLSLALRRTQEFDCLHHQIHLEKPLDQTGSHSIFLSFSHPSDTLRCGPEERVASVSTHVPDPANTLLHDKEAITNSILKTLAQHELVHPDDVLFHHSSTPGAWMKWTGRAWGFVGGYPQYMRIKPWQMLDARLDHRGAYLCGDSAYPGQGIPGAVLSGIIAAEKMRIDGAAG